jgi:hypothetical protein
MAGEDEILVVFWGVRGYWIVAGEGSDDVLLVGSVRLERD